MFLERYIDRAHHVEAQVFADARGNVAFLGERDCTVQRRHQKLIEETPSPIVDDELRARIGEAAMALSKEAGYVNAGTVECIVDEDGEFYFLEMNTRLQVEHTVTEMVTGLDLVALQIRVALGDKLDVSDVAPRGHAIQCRINAEDPARNFLPGPGRVTAYREPSGPFVRVDSGVRAGRDIPPDYDSMFAKLVVSAETRDRAIARMDRALDEFRVGGRADDDPAAPMDPAHARVPQVHALDDVAARGAPRRRAARTALRRRRPPTRSSRSRPSCSWRSTGAGSRCGSSTTGATRRRGSRRGRRPTAASTSTR